MRKLFWLLLVLACAMPVMGISRSGSCAAASTTCTLSAGASGTSILVYAFRNASTTAPSLPSGGHYTWQTVGSGSFGTSTNSVAWRLGCTVSDGTLTLDTWTNATDVIGVSYATLNQSTNCTSGFGNPTANGGKTITTLTFGFGGFTSNVNTWVAAFAGDSAASPCTPASTYISFTSVGTAPGVRGYDSNADIASPSQQTCSITSGNGMAVTVELIKPQLAAPTISPAAGNYTTAKTITITPPSGASACYTTDRSAPTAGNTGNCINGTTYTTGFSEGSSSVLSAVQVAAISTEAGFQNSNPALTPTVLYTFGIPHVAANSTSSPVTSAAIDTTSAKVLVAGCSVFMSTTGGTATGTITDSLNTWTPLTSYWAGTASTSFMQLSYVLNPVTSASHTFTCTLGGSATGSSILMLVLGFQSPYVGTLAFDGSCGNTGSGSTLASCASSLTPSSSTDLFIDMVALVNTNGSSINSGLSLVQVLGADGADAFLQASSNAALNPTWTLGGSATGNAASMVAFQPFVSATCTQSIPLLGVSNGC